jgi:hypothetical protein
MAAKRNYLSRSFFSLCGAEQLAVCCIVDNPEMHSHRKRRCS